MEEKLRNNIGMQMMFYIHSGATLEDTIDRIYDNAIDYAEWKAKSLSSKKCPHCGSIDVIMFNADDDLCNGCKKTIPGT